MKKVIAAGVALLFAGGLFSYLSTTFLMWRVVFSGLLFLSIYVFIEGFINYEG
ncbi:hypothetical protein [Marispirochaeta sp.]|jgi:hypothetical protein|uniref:hypothetical protein n=1 Tax=Marispirochaeta sp. TaxID=2038653 RepID=UPI0029C7BF80|nr:hypothetical protein [Marispirochaeta sp.]